MWNIYKYINILELCNVIMLCKYLTIIVNSTKVRSSNNKNFLIFDSAVRSRSNWSVDSQRGTIVSFLESSALSKKFSYTSTDKSQMQMWNAGAINGTEKLREESEETRFNFHLLLKRQRFPLLSFAFAGRRILLCSVRIKFRGFENSEL